MLAPGLDFRPFMITTARAPNAKCRNGRTPANHSPRLRTSWETIAGLHTRKYAAREACRRARDAVNLRGPARKLEEHT